ncbi:hypothetical protein NIES2100_76660 [Calothrix sp. NIES-2100]|uniref:hypothetical protein n=1 Tax=Calothrix sp. NIES-2100 TaxID=1954172 RepID=UPI000B5E0CF6|nr:hypothetical protein NIES2100_76660 [Calothrix sp. NIES-2100]
MSSFEKISALIAVIGLSIQFSGLCIQFTRSFDPPKLNKVQTPMLQTTSDIKQSKSYIAGCTEALIFSNSQHLTLTQGETP